MIDTDARYIPEEADLKGRTELYVATMDNAFKTESLDPRLLRSLQTGSARAHNDILATYLGIKPVATMLSLEIYGFNQNFYDQGFSLSSYLQHFPRPEVGGTELRTLRADEWFVSDLLAVWNPEVVRIVQEKNRDIFGDNPTDPNDYGFDYTLDNLNRYRFGPADEIPYGLLLGMPRRFVEEYAKYNDPLNAVCDEYAQGEVSGVGIFDPNAGMAPVAQVMYNENGAKDRLIKALDEAGKVLEPGLMAYLRSVRAAKIPGFRYTLTDSDLCADEIAFNKAWETSAIAPKIDSLLLSHGV